MQLMQKYSKEDGVVGVDDLQRWPVDSKAFGFLSATTSVPTITALQKVSQHSTIPKIRWPSIATFVHWEKWSCWSDNSGEVDLQ